jgi:hypothetical protein
VSELPASPETAMVLSVKPRSIFNLEQARAFAAQFGEWSEVFAPASGAGFLFIDGARRLLVSSDGSFDYYPAYTEFANNFELPPADEAQVAIDAFLASHGFEFEYGLYPAEGYNGYAALPVQPDGHPLFHEHFRANGLVVNFVDGQISNVSGRLLETEPVGEFGIISAQDALQRILDGEYVGMVEGTHSINGSLGPWQSWERDFALDETFTYYGWLSSAPSLEGGAPLVMLGAYRVRGNVADIPAEQELTFVAATGSLHGAGEFDLESWQVYDGFQEGLLGTLQQGAGGVELVLPEGTTLRIEDAPNDLALPMENVYALGVTRGDTFEWTSFDRRFGDGGGGGGGGGGSLFPLNLSGTAQPTPTEMAHPTVEPQSNGFTAAIERVELVYFSLRSAADLAQPMWRFWGRYSNGDEFEIFVQALQPEFLSPELQMLEGPG